MRLLRPAIGSAALVLGVATIALLTVPARAATVAPAPAQAPAPAATCTQQSFLEGTLVSDVDIARLAHDAGFSGEDWVISVAVAKAESAGWTRARLINVDCSVDRGLWQIN